MSRFLQRMISFVTAAALCFALCGCQNIIEEFTEHTVTEDMSAEPPTAEDGTRLVGELYGSFLTMYIGRTPAEERGLPYIKVLNSYAEVEEYYDTTVKEHVYGRLFFEAMVSFTDEFLAENDVLILALEEPSSYINHTAEPIAISDDRVSISVTRHAPEEAPMLSTEYRLIFTAPKGSFAGVNELPLELSISEVVDKDNNSAFDADLFRIYRPDFTTFCYRADLIQGDTGVIVDAIDSYDELVYFYDKYKDDFDLDSEFRADIRSLYNWELFDSYIFIATMIPCASETEPQITDLFINNLELFLTVDADALSDGEKPSACYLLLAGIERRELAGVDLGLLNLSFE